MAKRKKTRKAEYFCDLCGRHEWMTEAVWCGCNPSAPFRMHDLASVGNVMDQMHYLMSRKRAPILADDVDDVD